MNKSKVATWVVAGALALGSGMAVAETAPDDPEVVETGDETTTTTVEETTTTTAVAETTTTTVADTDEDDGDKPDREGAAKERPDNHGKVVSEAAKDRSRDEEFGNHGKYVSSVARDKAGKPEKSKGGATPAGETNAGDDED